VRAKLEAPELEKTAMLFWERHRRRHCRGMYIEDKVSGTGLIQTLRRKSVPVFPVGRDRDKYTRLLDALPYIASGLVMLPKAAPWLPAFLAECGEFSAEMNHGHDDQVDAMVDGVLKVFGRGISILDVVG
jgi:predicted phage terminase large subunit-like protein